MEAYSCANERPGEQPACDKWCGNRAKCPATDRVQPAEHTLDATRARVDAVNKQMQPTDKERRDDANANKLLSQLLSPRPTVPLHSPQGLMAVFKTANLIQKRRTAHQKKR